LYHHHPLAVLFISPYFIISVVRFKALILFRDDSIDLAGDTMKARGWRGKAAEIAGYLIVCVS